MFCDFRRPAERVVGRPAPETTPRPQWHVEPGILPGMTGPGGTRTGDAPAASRARRSLLRLLLSAILGAASADVSAQTGLPPCWTVAGDDFEGGTLEKWSRVPADSPESQPQVVAGAGVGGSNGMEVVLGAGSSYAYKSGLRPAREGYLTFWFHPNGAQIPGGAGWFVGNTFRIASIRGGVDWLVVAALRLRQEGGRHRAFLEYRDAALGTVYDYASGEFELPDRWQRITIGFEIDRSITVWQDDVVVRQLTGIDHAVDSGRIVEFGKASANSEIVPSGRIRFDDVSFLVRSVSELWVDAAAGDDGNPGTSSSAPFRTIQKAADESGPGTLVHVAPGIYAERVVLKYSGEPGAPVRFRSDVPRAAILDGTGIATDGDGGLFHVSRLSHVEVSGFHLRRSSGSGVFVYSSTDVRILDNSTHDTFSSGIKARRCDELLVHGNEIRLAVNGGSEECLTVANCTRFEVCHNRVHDGPGLYQGGEGIDVKDSSAHGSVHHNEVYDLPKDYDPAVHEDAEVGIYVDAYAAGNYLCDVDVHSNVVSASVGIAVGSEEGGHTDSVRVYDNVVHDCYSTGIQITNWVTPNTGPKTNISIVNNTVHRCGHMSGSWPVGNGIYVESRHPEDGGFVIRNNVVSGNLEFQIRVRAEASARTTVSHNLVDGYLGYTAEDVLGSDVVQGDPLFVDAANGDYRLQDGSPAIDAGTFLDAPAFDADGNPRPTVPGPGGAPDIGAYEHGSGVPPGESLTVERAGTGTGSVVSTPAGVSCGAECTAAFPTGTVVTLTAVADAGSTFVGWSGEGCSDTGSCVVTMTQARTVVATFDAVPTTPRTLTVTVVGNGGVTSSPPGLSCPGACEGTFPTLSTVTLSAAPGAGHRFAGWSGAGCEGTGACVLEMSSDEAVRAVFVPQGASTFHTVTPCRVVDTRNPEGPLGGPALTASATRAFALAGSCGIPADATAVSVNVTVTNPSAAGTLTVYPGTGPAPATSTVVFAADRTRANNATMGLIDGVLSVLDRQTTGTVDLILDVNGFFR